MLISMTGYGKSTQENKDISITVELRSINSRFLEIVYCKKIHTGTILHPSTKMIGILIHLLNLKIMNMLVD